MSKTFIDILEQLEVTSSTNEKIAILKENQDIPCLKEYLDLATNPKITFGIATMPDNMIFTMCNLDPNRLSCNDEFNIFKDLLNKLHTRNLTGNAAQNAIREIFSELNAKSYKWFEKCLLKDLSSVGLGLRLLEKAFGEVKKFKLMLAEEQSELDNVEDGPGYLDKKANGVRTIPNIVEGKTDIIYGGRNGLEAKSFYFIKKQLDKLIAELSNNLLDTPNYPIPWILNCVLDGEMHVDDSLEDTMTLYGFKFRDQSEFMGKKGLKQKAWENYVEDECRALRFMGKAKYVIFDIVPLDNWDEQSYSATLEQRKADLEVIKKCIEKLGLTMLEVIESEYVANKEEAIAKAQEWVARGFEGGIYKPLNGTYEWKRSRNWIKIKEKCDFEIKLTHYEIQKAKHNPDGTLKPVMVGAIFGIDREENIYKVGTGKALSEETRIDMLQNWEEKYLHKIATCSAQRPSGKGKYICPRLDIIRLDRNELD